MSISYNCLMRNGELCALSKDTKATQTVVSTQFPLSEYTMALLSSLWILFREGLNLVDFE